MLPTLLRLSLSATFTFIHFTDFFEFSKWTKSSLELRFIFDGEFQRGVASLQIELPAEVRAVIIVGKRGSFHVAGSIPKVSAIDYNKSAKSENRSRL
jgi:hypothetical protein